MKTFLVAGVAALLMTTVGSARAVEWQCGPHYVSTFVLHGEKLGIQSLLILFTIERAKT